jgi:predicted Rossmann fold nucleotide-binding protein DprA/Smf involved in DNA uptake
MTKIAIIGSRDGISRVQFYQEIEAIRQDNPQFFNESTEIISGGARGVDSFAEEFATTEKYGFRKILPESFSNNDSEYIKKTYLKRNREIIDSCDVLIAFQSKLSKTHGTAYSVNYAKGKNKKVIEIVI